MKNIEAHLMAILNDNACGREIDICNSRKAVKSGHKVFAGEKPSPHPKVCHLQRLFFERSVAVDDKAI